MATDIKVVLGYIEQQTCRAKGGRAASRATDIKDAAAARLESLVNGTAVGRGVENTDDMKKGTLTPAIRMDILQARINGFDARLAAMKTEIMLIAQEGATSLKIQVMDDMIRALGARRDKTVEEFISIMRGMAETDE